MVGIVMPRPIRRSGSSNFYYRAAIPSDLRALVKALPKGERPVGWSDDQIWISLRTSDRAEARLRFSSVSDEVEKAKAALRVAARAATAAPVTLSHRQATAIAGEAYRAAVAPLLRRVTVQHSAATGRFEVQAPEHITAAEWGAVIRHWEAKGEAASLPQLERLLGRVANRRLYAHGIPKVDDPSRAMLLEAMWKGMHDAFLNQQRNTEGDYSPDPKAGRFPAFENKRLPFSELIDGWSAERQPRRATVETYRTHLSEFAAFLGHDDASLVTTDDVVRWKNDLLATGRLAAKTINEKHLAAVKAVFGWAKANRKLESNPAQGVAVKSKKPPRSRSKGFTEQEAKVILKAAKKSATPAQALAKKQAAARRWVPWLCCYSGARVAEITQLRGADIQRDRKVWFMVLTPEAGSIKSDHFRRVPLHRDLIKQGFVEHVKKAGDGPLFYDPDARRKENPRKPPAQTVANKLAAWVREVGVKDPAVAPNHGWRHRFATECRRHGVSEGAEMALKGHAPKTEGAAYGDWPVDVLAKELAKLPSIVA